MGTLTVYTILGWLKQAGIWMYFHNPTTSHYQFNTKPFYIHVLIYYLLLILFLRQSFLLYYIYQMDTQSSYLDEYRIIKTLGSGYHAKVKLAEAPDKTLVAIKRFKQETANLGTLKHELSIMKKLHHENLVNLIDVRENATYKKKTGEVYKCFAIILEYVGGGQLFDFVAIGGRFSQTIARTYFYQLMNAVHYMHEKGYAHRDIKPENILLTNKYVLKLADFGFATLLEGKDKSYVLHTKLGTQGYMAPQVQTKNYDGRKADIFSCGVILFIMLTATPPFERSVPNDPYYKLIKDKNYATFWGYHSKRRTAGFFSDSFKDLIQQMLAYNPNERPTMIEVSQHPWVKGQVVSISSLQDQFDFRKNKVDHEMEKQRLDRQKKKDQIKQAIFNPSKVNRGQNLMIDEFKDQFEKEEGIQRKLELKGQICNNDYVIDQTQDFVFTSLSLYLKKKVVLHDEESQDIELTPTFSINNDKINIVYSYKYDELVQKVEIQLKVSRTADKKLVLSFRRESGNFLYYKRLVLLLEEQFVYCH